MATLATCTSDPFVGFTSLHDYEGDDVMKWLVAALSTNAELQLGEDAAEAVSEGILFTLTLFISSIPIFHLQLFVLPPCIFANVAVDTCLSAGFLYSALE